ncbi:MAG TPA: TonB-dependent receptor [Candidatus Eisenbacteria bacterium]
MIPLRAARAAVIAPVIAVSIACSGASAAALAPGSALADSARIDSTRADSAAAGETRKLGMADTVTVLPPVRVDADRSLTPSRASATTVRIDRGTLVRFQPSTTADALLAAPGVDVSRTGPWASRVSLRGLSGERVLVLVDGVRLQSGRGHGAQTSLVSVDRLESVELMPGAGGAQFGSDALGGVVELNTHRNLLGERRSSLLLAGRSGGPGGERSGTARMRWMAPRFAAEMSGGLGGLDALVTPDGRVPNSSYREDEYAARMQARLGSSLLDLERTRHAAHDIELPAFNDQAGSHAEYPLQSRGATRLEWVLPGGRTRPDLRLLGVEQHFRTGFIETVADSQFLRGRYVATRTSRADDRIDTWSNGLQPTLQRGALRVYGEYRHESTRGPRATDITVVNAAGAQTSTARTTGESIPPARRDVLAAGVFDAATWKRLRFETGARYDWLRSAADSTPASFTPTLDVTDRRWSFEGGLSRPLGAWTPYGRVASGFRAPNLEERYFNDDVHGGLRLFGNPDLRAERTQTVELGVRAGELAGGRLGGARLSAYRSYVADLITLRYLGQLYLVPRFQYTNVHKAQLDGVELEIQSTLGAVQLAANAAFPRGRDLETGAAISDLGAARATLDVRFPLPALLPAGALAVRARWTDASAKGDVALARPSFWTSSLELSCLAWNTRTTLAVKNVTNTRYREPLSFIPEPGRGVLLSMRRELALPW